MIPEFDKTVLDFAHATGQLDSFTVLAIASARPLLKPLRNG